MWKFIKRNKIWFILVIIFVLVLVTSIKLINNYFAADVLIIIDRPINQMIVGLRTPFLNKLMLLVTLTGNWQMVVWGSLLASILLIISQKRHYLIALLSSDVSALIFIVIIKNLIGRIRPPVENALIIERGFALPSGHAYFGVVFYGLLTYFLVHHCHQKWLKTGYSILGSVYILLLASSRIYLGVHWATDVVAGLSFGVIWLAVIVSYIEYTTRFFKEKHQAVNQKLIQTGLGLFIALWLLELFWLYQNNVNTLGTKIIKPINAATTETTNTAPAAKSRAKVVSEY